MKLFLLCFALCIATTGYVQTNTPQPCASKEASEFDFWIGDWNLTWSDSLHGTNHVEKLFGNCTVHENFSDPNTNYAGQSWSVYNANTKQWQQTWVDSQGGYIALTGSKANDSIVLKTAERTVPVTLSPSSKLINRMVYFNIQPTAFDWSWEASTDGGLTWKPNWHIHYARK